MNHDSMIIENAWKFEVPSFSRFKDIAENRDEMPVMARIIEPDRKALMVLVIDDFRELGFRFQTKDKNWSKVNEYEK